MLSQQKTQYNVDVKRLNPDIASRIIYYAHWLANRADTTTPEQTQEANIYREEAMKSVLINGQEVSTFAPIQPRLSALQTITSSQKRILQLLGIAYAVGLIFYSVPALQDIVIALTIFYIVDLITYFILSMRVVARQVEEHIDDTAVHTLADAPWPRYTILCPLYKEAEVVPQFVEAMLAMDYPTDKLQILFLTETDDQITRNAIAAMKLPAHFEIVIVPDGPLRTKPRACNYGLLQAIGEYVVIFDAEDIPDPLQLKKAVLAFSHHGPDVACVQAKLNFYNAEQNILTRWFTAEYSSWFDMTLPGLQTLNVPLPLGGTSNHFRTDLLRKVGAWDAFNVTEDCDLGLRLGHFKLKTIVMDSTTYEEANPQVKNWLRQRSRWIKGYMQTYLVHMRRPFEYLRPGRLREFLSLQLVIGGKTAILLVNPLMWMLVAVYFLFYPFVGNAYHILYPMPILYMGSLCLIFGNFMYMYIHLIGCMKRGNFNIVKWAIFMPIYWALGSVAAYIALYQLIFKPHYWEKTLHGLHLRKKAVPHTSVTEEPETDAVELLTTRRSATLSLTAEDFEIEMVERTVKLKVHTSGRLPAIPKQLPLKGQDQSVVEAMLTEISQDMHADADDDDTLELKALQFTAPDDDDTLELKALHPPVPDVQPEHNP